MPFSSFSSCGTKCAWIRCASSLVVSPFRMAENCLSTVMASLVTSGWAECENTIKFSTIWSPIFSWDKINLHSPVKESSSGRKGKRRLSSCNIGTTKSVLIQAAGLHVAAALTMATTRVRYRVSGRACTCEIGERLAVIEFQRAHPRNWNWKRPMGQQYLPGQGRVG